MGNHYSKEITQVASQTGRESFSTYTVRDW